MDKSVKRVTVVEGSGEDRLSKVVYDDPKDPDEAELPPLERAVRHVVNAALIGVQVAYDTYLSRWIFRPHEKGTKPRAEPVAKPAADMHAGAGPDVSVKTPYGQFDTRLD
jgi:hypothetical protein